MPTARGFIFDEHRKKLVARPSFTSAAMENDKGRVDRRFLQMLMTIMEDADIGGMQNDFESNRIDWESIEGFIGFGCLDAPVVFIGMEEGLKSTDALLEDLIIRSAYAPVMDLAEAHKGIQGTERYFDPNNAPRQPTWRVMADLMLRREGQVTPTGADRRRYRALRLGRSNGDTLLTELLPYPHPKARDWLYGGFGRYNTRSDYEREMLPQRLRLLKSVLLKFPRDLIVCYGKSDWPYYKRLFDEAIWRDKMPFQVADIDRHRIILTTHFSTRGFNGEDGLARLAEVALRERSTLGNRSPNHF